MKNSRTLPGGLVHFRNLDTQAPQVGPSFLGVKMEDLLHRSLDRESNIGSASSSRSQMFAPAPIAVQYSLTNHQDCSATYSLISHNLFPRKNLLVFHDATIRSFIQSFPLQSRAMALDACRKRRGKRAHTITRPLPFRRSIVASWYEYACPIFWSTSRTVARHKREVRQSPLRRLSPRHRGDR